jgi:hypothetical protein
MRRHERDRREEAEPEVLPVQRPRPIHNVLALQRSAGNQAVAAMLARDPIAEETKGGGKKETAVGHVKLAGIGQIEVSSFTVGGSSGKATEYTFTSAVGSHSAKLIQAMIDGKAVDAEIDVQGMKLKLTKVHISSYSSTSVEGEPLETFTLMPQTSRLDDGSGGGGGGGSGWGDNPAPG